MLIGEKLISWKCNKML